MIERYLEMIHVCNNVHGCAACDNGKYAELEGFFKQCIKELDEKDEEIALLKERIAIMAENMEDDLK